MATATNNDLGREVFKAAAAARWTEGRAKHGPTLSMRHPLMEAWEEALDQYNYVRLLPRDLVTRDLVLTVESLGVLLTLMVAQLKEAGVDLAQFPSSASSTPRTY